jgi:FKBP-type peptidyl-prolyl cis-trans isomerase
MRPIALATVLLTLAAAAPAGAEDPKPTETKPAETAKPAEPAKPAQPEAAKPAEAAKPPGHSAAPAPAPAPKASPQDEAKTLYGVGLAIARSLETFALTPAELDNVIRGVRDGVTGKPKMPLDQKLQSSINDLARTRAQKAADKAAAREKDAGAPYLAKMAKDPKAKKTASGAIVIPTQEGTGAQPKDTDKVKVNYTGTLVNGTVFDSSAGRGPAEFPLNQVIKCWTEALQTMKVGGKAKVVCPSAIAYGDRGNPPVIPGNAVLTFDVELLDIVK